MLIKTAQPDLSSLLETTSSISASVLSRFLTTLDSFTSGEPEAEELQAEEDVGEEATVERAEGAEEGEEEAMAGRCGVCGEGSRFERLRLHAGALCLYFKDGRWLVRADIDHVYHRCRKGLIDNLRLLKRLYDHLYTNGRSSRDGRLRLLGVSKAYDDDLYAYGVGRFPEEFEGLKIKNLEVEKVETLEGATLQLRARARGSSQGGP
jgi:hypothetical protein